MTENQNVPEEQELPEGIDIEEFKAFMQQLTGGMSEDQQRAGQEAFARGKEELRSHGDALDPHMHHFMDLITDWALEVQQEFNLSPEAVCVMLETAPPAHDLFHSIMNDRRREQEATEDGGN